MKVHWEVEDGYVGKSRPQETHIDDEEWQDTPPEDREEFIEECVREDFDNRIGFAVYRTSEVPEDDGRYDEG